MFLLGCACRYTKTNIQTAEKQYNSTTMEIPCHIISYHIISSFKWVLKKCPFGQTSAQEALEPVAPVASLRHQKR